MPHGTPHPITGEKVPLTLGHEFSGIVEEVGSEIRDVKTGDRVCVQPIIYDGTCSACKAGYINCCDKNGFIGLSGWGGGLSEHIVVPRSAVVALPDSVSLELGALVEPLAVAWHAVDRSPLKKGDSVLVLGGGPIGLATVQCLKARGVEQVIVSEVAPKRKDFAKQFGADHVVDPTKEDIVESVRKLTGGQGVNIAFDAAGVQQALGPAMLAVRARGTLVNIAVWEKPPTVSCNDLTFRERHYIGVATYVAGDFQAVIDALASGLSTVFPDRRELVLTQRRETEARVNDHSQDQDGRGGREGIQCPDQRQRQSCQDISRCRSLKPGHGALLGLEGWLYSKLAEGLLLQNGARRAFRLFKLKMFCVVRRDTEQ